MDMPNENEYLAISIFIYLTDLTVFGNMTNNNITCYNFVFHNMPIIH